MTRPISATVLRSLASRSRSAYSRACSRAGARRAATRSMVARSASVYIRSVFDRRSTVPTTRPSAIIGADRNDFRPASMDLLTDGNFSRTAVGPLEWRTRPVRFCVTCELSPASTPCFVPSPHPLILVPRTNTRVNRDPSGSSRATVNRSKRTRRCTRSDICLYTSRSGLPWARMALISDSAEARILSASDANCARLTALMSLKTVRIAGLPPNTTGRFEIFIQDSVPSSAMTVNSRPESTPSFSNRFRNSARREGST